jgi:hypothetical protein
MISETSSKVFFRALISNGSFVTAIKQLASNFSLCGNILRTLAKRVFSSDARAVFAEATSTTMTSRALPNFNEVLMFAVAKNR